MADDDATEKLKQAFLKACGATGSLEAAKAAAKALGDEPLASVYARKMRARDAAETRNRRSPGGGDGRGAT